MPHSPTRADDLDRQIERFQQQINQGWARMSHEYGLAARSELSAFFLADLLPPDADPPAAEPLGSQVP